MIEIIGLEDVLDTIQNYVSVENIESAVEQACALVERRAKEEAPVLTGELRRSITSEVEASETEVRGVVYTPLEYAPYVEYGTGLFAENGGRADVPWNYKDDKGEWHSTSGQHPQPFMAPALHDSREDVVSIIREGLFND